MIQPGLERVRDPEFQASVRGYVDAASKQVTTAGTTVNTWGKQQFGVDVAESVGGVVDNVKERAGLGGHEGYGALPQSHDGDSGWDRYEDEEDFFQEHAAGSSSFGSSANQTGQSAPASSTNTTTSAKKAEDWDEWKDF